MTATIVWLRNDLRIADNRALCAAAARGGPVVPIFVLDEGAQGPWRAGAASRWWLHQSLSRLAKTYRALGAPLILRSGASAETLLEVARTCGADSVYTSRAYEPWARQLEEDVRSALAGSAIEVKRFSGALLCEPERIATKQGEPFKVYTPFWRALVGGGAPPQPVAAPASLKRTGRQPSSEQLSSWGLLPAGPDWTRGLGETWEPGEAGAARRLERFLEEALATYAHGRDRPDRAGTSRLSPHLHFGELSPGRVWHAASASAAARGLGGSDLETFLKELVWREFSYHLLFHWPELPDEPFRPEFAAYPWSGATAELRAWQRGRTGYPMVDAGMRELWHTGYMHNRVRMLAASFLVKHLMVRWQEGERWFWDTLVDADLASNSASWQWVAGSGADAAPYFRIFNPVTQGTRYDPEGDYVRTWVPELRALPTPHIHAPWLAPDSVLAAAGVRLGVDYPHPMVDHVAARKRALEGYEDVKIAARSAAAKR